MYIFYIYIYVYIYIYIYIYIYKHIYYIYMYMQSFLDFLLFVKRLQIWYGTYVFCICFFPHKAWKKPGNMTNL